VELGRPESAAGRVALPIAGDSMQAKRIVMRLVDQLGFELVDAGSIDESWRQQTAPETGTALLGAAVSDPLETTGHAGVTISEPIPAGRPGRRQA
jgi:predicted dinucleotide-binding enzyme